MRRRGLLGLGVALASSACSAQSDFYQTECRVDDDYVSIWLSEGRTAVDNPNRRNVNFQREAIVFRIDPIWYAKRWRDIDEIEISRTSGSDSVFLRIRFHDGATAQTEDVGFVQRSCVDEIDALMQRHDIAVPIVQGGPA